MYLHIVNYDTTVDTSIML